MKEPAYNPWVANIVIGVIGIVGIILAILFFTGRLPDGTFLIPLITSLYKQYGYPIIILGAFIEGLFLIGNYFPGSIVIILGAALSREGVLSFPIVILFAVLGLNLGYSVNYILGQHGWYHVLSRFGLDAHVKTAENKLKHNANTTIFLGYFSIVTASFISTAAGVVKMPFRKFITLSLLSQTFWSIAWGTLAYFFGYTIIELMLKYLVVIVVAIGIFVTWKTLSKPL